MLKIYYTDLIELTAALVFLVVFKVLLLIGMRKMSTLLSEEPPAPKKSVALPSHLKVIRYALTFLLVLDGIWQVPPSMLKVSAKSLMLAGTSGGLAHWWVSHALWLNVWSVVIELSLAALLFSFSHPLAVRISSAVIGLYGLFIWVTLQEFGHFGASSPTFLAGSPGTGLLMFLTCIPLVFHELPWRKYFQFVVALYWLGFCVSLWTPFSKFWTGQGYKVFAQVHPAGLPGILGNAFSHTSTFFADHGVFMTALLGVIALALAFWWFKSQNLGVLAVTLIVLALLWVIPEGLGFGGAYAFAGGSAPVVAIWVFVAWLGKREGVVS